MGRTRRVLAASGVSVVIVAGSTAFAVASGLFVNQPVDRVGSFQAIEARLVPVRKPVETTTTTGAGPRNTSSTTTTQTLPVNETTTSNAVQREPTTVITSAPVVQPATTVPVAHSGPSVVGAKYDDDNNSKDDHNAKEVRPSDD